MSDSRYTIPLMAPSAPPPKIVLAKHEIKLVMRIRQLRNLGAGSLVVIEPSTMSVYVLERELQPFTEEKPISTPRQNGEST